MLQNIIVIQVYNILEHITLCLLNPPLFLLLPNSLFTIVLLYFHLLLHVISYISIYDFVYYVKPRKHK